MAAFCAPLIAGVDANRTIKDELAAAITRRSARRRIAVTDLLNPRQAYFQRAHPELSASPDRVQAMMAGTGFHDLFGRAVSTEEYVEQMVEFQEIVGKIDIFEDAPLELKTTSALPSNVLADRTSHAEQLAMYCVMVGRPYGHLLYYRRAEYGRAPVLRAYDLGVTDPGPVAREMVRRRDLLRSAFAAGEPSGLPRCAWLGRRCAYEALCGCEGADPLVTMVSDATVTLRENPELAARLRERVEAAGAERDGRRIGLADLVLPRRAAYRLRGGSGAGDEEDAEARMASLERRGFEDTLMDAIWYGAPGACRRRKVPFGPIRASILLFRDVPTLVRTYRRPEMIPRDRIMVDRPFYLDRLAFECAITEVDRGRLIIYYSAIPDEKFMVYDFWFKGLPEIRAEMERRVALLESGAPPEALPACEPAWMSKMCPYAPVCGCGGGSPPIG